MNYNTAYDYASSAAIRAEYANAYPASEKQIKYIAVLASKRVSGLDGLTEQNLILTSKKASRLIEEIKNTPEATAEEMAVEKAEYQVYMDEEADRRKAKRKSREIMRAEGYKKGDQVEINLGGPNWFPAVVVRGGGKPQVQQPGHSTKDTIRSTGCIRHLVVKDSDEGDQQ